MYVCIADPPSAQDKYVGITLATRDSSDSESLNLVPISRLLPHIIPSWLDGNPVLFKAGAPKLFHQEGQNEHLSEGCRLNVII